MAYTAGNLQGLVNAPPGRMLYRYDSTDQVDVVEDAGYFNNSDDNLNLAIGDRIDAFTWSATPFAAGSTISEAKQFVVTNVIANDAAASAGNVNVAEVFLSSGLLSSQG
jgi:hypothetical protein